MYLSMSDRITPFIVCTDYNAEDMIDRLTIQCMIWPVGVRAYLTGVTIVFLNLSFRPLSS